MDRHTDPQYRSEDGNALRIWRDTAQNNFLSEQAGRPVFDEVIFVEVIAPGSGNSTPVFEVKRFLADKRGTKVSQQYERFKKFVDDFEADDSNDTTLAGTPLSQWPEMSRTLVAELKAAKIFTVDALAALSDNKLGAVGPDGRTWRAKAIAFLEAAKSGSYATRLAAELEESRRETTDLREQLAALAARLDAEDAQDAEKGSKGSKGGKGAKTPPAPVLVADPNAAPTVLTTDGLGGTTVLTEGAPVAVAAEGDTLVPATPAVEIGTAAAAIDGMDGKFGNDAPII